MYQSWVIVPSRIIIKHHDVFLLNLYLTATAIFFSVMLLGGSSCTILVLINEFHRGSHVNNETNSSYEPSPTIHVTKHAWHFLVNLICYWFNSFQHHFYCAWYFMKRTTIFEAEQTSLTLWNSVNLWIFNTVSHCVRLTISSTLECLLFVMKVWAKLPSNFTRDQSYFSCKNRSAENSRGN